MTKMYKVASVMEMDLPIVQQLYNDAIRYQQKLGYQGWVEIDGTFLLAEVKRGWLMKLMDGTSIVAVFSVCFEDRLIWGAEEKGDALYLHRLVVDQSLKSERLFSTVMEWLQLLAKKCALERIRMDTWADNSKLIGYYVEHGFTVVGTCTTSDDSRLPLQHRNLEVSLLEYLVA